MKRAWPADAAMPLYDKAATRRIEANAQLALEPQALMQRAGLAVARLALAVAPHARCIWVAAGPGNNGGDGFEAAAHLRHWGKQVEIGSLVEASKQPADARRALQRAQIAGVAIHDGSEIRVAPDLVIDALLGIGAGRAPQGAIGDAIRHVNAAKCPVLAVDVPSGLNADTGNRLGDFGVVAEHTLSLLTLKPGLFTAAGRDHCGTVWLDSLGVPAGSEAPCAMLAGATELGELTPRRQHAQHKGSFGDVAVVGGATGMSGAAWLAARAALAAGAGRVYVDLLEPQAAAHDPLRPELMVRPGWALGDPGVLAASLVVCGCGGGEAIRAVLPALLSHVPRLVIDADGLNAVAGDEQLQSLLRARTGRGHVTVLTPHPLEAARLLGLSAAQVQADRLGAARQLAAAFTCVVVLKGSGTVVAATHRVPSINPTGNAALATAGTGDVLAGWLGGCWAQFDASARSEAAFDAARISIFVHGQAADQQPAGPLRASDLIEAMHRGHWARGSA